MSRHPLTFMTLLLAGTLAATLSAEIRFTSTWKSIDAGSVGFGGKKLAALVISKNDSLRVAGEESLVRELTARGLQAVASYRIAPKEELAKPETARPWFERAGIEGIVALRPVSVDTQRTYTPSTWISTSYSSLWSYYGYGWATVWVPGSTSVDTSVVLETTIYSVPGNQLLWAAVTQTTSSRNLQSFVEELVKRSVEVMHEQGLARRIQK